MKSWILVLTTVVLLISVQGILARDNNDESYNSADSWGSDSNSWGSGSWGSSSSASSGSSKENETCYGVPNPYKVWTGEPVLIREVDNGVLYKTGPTNNTVNVLHLYGTPYEMGVAHGQLLKEEIQAMMPQFMQYADEQIGEMFGVFGDFIPGFIKKIIEEFGVNIALDYIAKENKPFTPSEFFEELQGLSDGSGVDYKTIIRLHMFPELIKAHCSIVGAWGEATAHGGLLQVRALDWGINNPLVTVPTFIVYHPQQGSGNVFSILSWSGYIGALTGYSQRLGVSQKVWLKYNGTYSYAGIPFYFNLRDMLQYDETINDAVDRIMESQRTCSIFLGIGSNDTDTAVVVEYSHDYIKVFDDLTPFPGYAPTPKFHPLLKDIVYVDKHTQPSHDPCLGTMLSDSYGQLTPDVLINIIGLAQTGDLHAAIYDYQSNHVYISVATTDVPRVWPLEDPKDIKPAYENMWILLDMNQLFN